MITFEIYDIETLNNLFTYTGYDYKNDKFYQFSICDWNNQCGELIDYLLKIKRVQIGFNNEAFDYHIIHELLLNKDLYVQMSGSHAANLLYQKAQEIIKEEKNKIIFDKDKFIHQIDLYKIWHFNNKAKSCSLKDIEIALNMHNVEEMPINHQKWCNEEDEECVLKYNKNDVIATYEFYKITLGKTENPLYKGKNKLDLRQKLNNKFNINCLNYNDIKIGEKLILKLYCDQTKKNINELKKKGGTVRSSVSLKDCIPNWANFESEEFNNLKNKIQNTVITDFENGFSDSILYHDIRLDYGMGGCHGCIKPGIYSINDTQLLVDQDVASLYPSLAVNLKLYPEQLGPEFSDIYNNNIVSVRLKEKLKSELEKDDVIIEGFKLAANGVFGKTGDEKSVLFDYLYFFKTTIAGQLFISLWIEKLSKAIPDIKFIQANTDGITYIINKDKLEIVNKITNELHDLTGLTIENNFYKKIIIRDVNNYLAIYENGKIKSKGCFEIDKEMHKDHSMRIVPIALREYFINNKPIVETIKNHKNIFDFCLRMKTRADCKGFYQYYKNGKLEYQLLPRTTRYYISKPSINSGVLLKNFSDNKKNSVNAGFMVTLFNKYEEKEINNYNIDYNFYIAETNKIINAIEDFQLNLFE